MHECGLAIRQFRMQHGPHSVAKLSVGRGRAPALPWLATQRYGIRIVTSLDPRCIAGWSKRNRKSGKGDVQSCVLVIWPLARLDLGLNIALERTLVSTDRCLVFHDRSR